MSNFWNHLPAGFIGLSPMDGVTDQPFRHIQKKYGNPAVMYTEFTCVEGITHGAVRLLKDFLFDQTQRPIIAQIYGHTPVDFQTVTTIVCALGFDGVDINMGCPAKNVTHSGSGAALIKTPQLAKKIVHSVKKGVADWVNGKDIDDLPLTEEIKNTLQLVISSASPRLVSLGRKDSQSESESRNPFRSSIPVSIKTRVGFDKPVTEDWIKTLLETEPVAIALHGRTLKQYYGGDASWQEIGKAVQTAAGSGVKIIGNGDVKTLEQAQNKISDYGVDGVLLGRAAMGNPWVFTGHQPTVAEKFAVALEHSKLYENTYQNDERYNFLPMRKHLGWYIKDFPNASQLRQQLIRSDGVADVEKILRFNESEFTNS